MNAPSPRMIFLTAVLVSIFLLMWRDRKNVERVGILFFRRTKNGIELIDKIAKKFPRFWNIYAWGGVLAAFASILLISLVVGNSVYGVLETGNPSEDFGLVAPGTGSSVSTQPGVTFVPAEYWLISIAILMVVHELSHGIVARLEDFEINSVGVLVLGIIPGAFVEPKGDNMLPGDEEENDTKDADESHGAWDQGNWISRIKVLSAGSWANYLTAAVFLVSAIGFSNAVSFPNGINYQAQQDFPAAQAGMQNGTLESINEMPIKNIEDIRQATEELAPGETVDIVTTEGEFTVTATQKQGFEGGYIGLRFTGVETEYKEGFRRFSGIIGWITGLLQVVAFLNLGIGLFNMLPAKPLDGGHILDAVVERFAGEEYRHYVNAWSGMVILTLIFVIGYSIFAA
jgi:membrane-associated protease RseP (regulator of RpoE activity)